MSAIERARNAATNRVYTGTSAHPESATEIPTRIAKADLLALVEIADAARDFIATTTVFRQRRVSRDAFTRLAVAVHWTNDPRAENGQTSADK